MIMPKRKTRGNARFENIGSNASPDISYMVEIDGVVFTKVDSISGLGVGTEEINYMNGDNPLKFKRPGPIIFSNITIHNIPLAEEAPFMNWVGMIMQSGGVVNDLSNLGKNMAIVMFDGETEIRRWNCFNCFPLNYGYHKMETNKPLYADFTIAVERFENV